jgi:hypothetical protein
MCATEGARSRSACEAARRSIGRTRFNTGFGGVLLALTALTIQTSSVGPAVHKAAMAAGVA